MYFNKSLKFLTIALQVHGIYSAAKSTSRYFIILNLYQACIMSAYFAITIFSICNDGVVVLDSYSDISVWTHSLGFLDYYLMTLATYAILLAKRQSLRLLLENISIQCEDVFKSKPKNIFFAVMLTVVVPYVVSLIFVLLEIIRSNYSLYRTLFTIIWGCIVSPISLFCMTFGVFICYIVCSIFEQFKKNIQSQLDRQLDHHTWGQVGKSFITQHKRLNKLVDEFNNIYANIYLVHFIFDVTFTIFLIRAFNLNRPMQDWNWNLLISITQTVGLFLMQVVTVSYVNSQILSSINLIKPQLMTSDYHTDKTRLSILMTNSNISLYIQQVSSNPATITAGNFITINNTAIISVGATALTYILVLYGNSN